jgi:multisubunit Na+/H+ antiporter MnhG subunit
MVLPVIILILGVCLQAIGALGIQLTNAALARQAAGQLSRGTDISLVVAALAAANSSAQFAREDQGELLCVSLTQDVGAGPLALIVHEVRVRECVLDAN